VRRIDPVVDYEHGLDPAKGRIAAGWIKRAEVRDNGLYLGVQFNDSGKQDVKAKHYRYISAEIHNDWEDEDGNKYKDVVVAATLTNRPYMKSLDEFALVASDDFLKSLSTEQPEHTALSEEDVATAFAAMLLGEGANYYDVSFVQDMIRKCYGAIESAVGELRSGNDASVKAIARQTVKEERESVNKYIDWVLSWDESTTATPLY
jgi:hypothetical protein